MDGEAAGLLTMQFHESPALFPMMKGSEYQDLVNSIKVNGLLEPIIIFQGKILDGRNRYRACLKAGVEPRFSYLPDNINPWEYVWAVNAERRHLPPGQKAVIKILQLKQSETWRQAQMARIKEADRRRSEATREQHTISNPRRGESSGPVSCDTAPKRERDDIAQATQVSTATVARACALVSKRPDLAEKVASGETTLTNALRIAKKDELKGAVPLPAGKYRVLYVDPPWKYSDSRGELPYGPAESHYPAMSLPELCALEVPADDNAVLFLWTTVPMLEDAFKVINAWGFKYKGLFVWDKVKHNYGHYNSVRCEILLIATKGSCTPGTSRLYDNVVSIERSEIHSAKPEYFYEIIEALYPEEQFCKACELFRRSNENPARPGWDAWGNEC